MFTGIIKSIGTVVSVQKKDGKRIYVIDPHLENKWDKGSSVAVSGVCSTIVKKGGKNLVFQYMDQTANLTSLKEWTLHSKVNIEPSLKVGDELSGHFVSGHIDGVAKINAIKKTPAQYAITCALPHRLALYTVPKGSITLDGVSLTIGRLKKNEVTVFLTPFTYKNTTFQYKKIGDHVNVEADMLAKYIYRYLYTICSRKKHA